MNILHHLRKRPGMYIGNLYLTGFKNMIGGVFETLKCNQSTVVNITIEFKKENRIRIEINGMDNTLLKKNIDNINNEMYVYDWKNTGIPILIGLSENIKITVLQPQITTTLIAKKGVASIDTANILNEQEKTIIDFNIDFDIFNKFEINYEVINQFIRKYAFLNPAFKIKSIDSTTSDPQVNVYYYPQGIAHQLDYVMGSITYYSHPLFRLDYQTSINGYDYQVSFCYMSSGKSYAMSYANNDELVAGGSLIDGILDGIIAAIKYVSKKNNQKVKITRATLKESLILIASVKGDEFTFGASTRINLNMPQMRKEIKNYMYHNVSSYLLNNINVSSCLLNNINVFNAFIRKLIATLD